MDTIKAIVLTYDRNRTVTDHMISCYNKLWPAHPFCFRVPYQELAPSLKTNRVEYIKSPSEIKATVLTLLEDLEDEEMIYWCIDDKYPIKLDIRKIESLHQSLFCGNELESVDGLLFCRFRDLLLNENLTGEIITTPQENVLLERAHYHQIWIPQYLKVKVIRHIFNSFPDEIGKAKDMDHLIKKMDKPNSHRLFVTRENFAVIGESTTRGRLTQNCAESMIKKKLTLPSWYLDDPHLKMVVGGRETVFGPGKIVMGEMQKGILSSFFQRLKKAVAWLYQ